MLRYYIFCGKNATTADNQQGKIMNIERDLELIKRNRAIEDELGLNTQLDEKIRIGLALNIGQHSANLDPSGSMHKGNARITAINLGRTYAYADCSMRGCNVRQIWNGNGTKSDLFIRK